ncbi:hypothetical protein Ddye_013189 [Dipteronia dyeriana]|uniref:Uncharacterized protein n=1 Tax=Dipteronia dyeriana TaxID=168575 RepID=A0AAD9X634_9ROSI|nr:hypothetical protein Ddye_013189 [Dipteronia dyeriana]
MVRSGHHRSLVSLLLCRLDPVISPPLYFRSESFIVNPVLSLFLYSQSESFIIDLVLKLLLRRRDLDILYRQPISRCNSGSPPSSLPYGYFVSGKAWRSWLPPADPPPA